MKNYSWQCVPKLESLYVIEENEKFDFVAGAVAIVVEAAYAGCMHGTYKIHG